jgi:hypothetical protein
MASCFIAALVIDPNGYLYLADDLRWVYKHQIRDIDTPKAMYRRRTCLEALWSSSIMDLCRARSTRVYLPTSDHLIQKDRTYLARPAIINFLTRCSSDGQRAPLPKVSVADEAAVFLLPVGHLPSIDVPGPFDKAL